MTETVALIASLNAQLDEDEAAARAAASVAGPDWHHDLFIEANGGATTMITSAAGSPLADTLRRDDEEMAPFIARHDPARVLREVAAKRALLALVDDIFHTRVDAEWSVGVDILQCLAAVYE